jgi:uncharacterized SAM-binding protein YcdF (DUF218 family)
MHSFLSSSISLVLSPLHWIVILLLAMLLFRKKRQRRLLGFFALLIFLIFSNSRLLNNFARHFQPAPVKMAMGTVYSCGIVAGGFASPVQGGEGVFNSSAERFIQTLKLFKQGHITNILVSGGNGKKELASFREGAWVKNELVIMGVPDSVIMVEDRSGNTKDNASNSRKLLAAAQLQPPFLLVSSAHHLPRATVLFKNAGIDVIPFPTNYIAGRGINTAADWIPDLGVLHTWNIFLKEWLWVKWNG